MSDFSFLPPFQIPTLRGFKSCSLCSTPYTLLNTQHLCKRCLRSICDQCIGSLQHPIFTISYKQSLHKICKSCKHEADVMEKYIELYQLKFFSNSAFAGQWARRLQARDVKNRKKGFHGHVDEDKAARELWASLNFSMREFVVRVWGECEKDGIQEVMRHSVRLALMVRSFLNVEFEMTVYTTLLVASHCQDDIAVQILLQLHQQVLPQITQPSIKQYLQQGCSHLQPNSPSFYYQKLCQYLQCRMSRFSSNLSINLFPTELAIHFLNAVLTRSSHKEYEKALAAALLSRRGFICNNVSKVEEVDLELMRGCTSGEVAEVMKLFVEKEQEEGGAQGGEKTEKEKEVVKKKEDPMVMLGRLREENRVLLQKEVKYLETIKRLEQRVEEERNIRKRAYYNEEQEDQEQQQQNAPTDQLSPQGQPTSTAKPRKSRHLSRSSINSNSQQNKVVQQVIMQKNLRIDQLSRDRDLLSLQLTQLKQQLTLQKSSHPSNFSPQLNPTNLELTERLLQIEQLKKQLQKANTEKANVMHMNELLMRKFNELSKQLVEKEEVRMQAAQEEVDERIRQMDPEEVRQRMESGGCGMF